MAVSARFEADFSQFVAATKTAETALGKVEAGGARAGRSFTLLEGGADTAAGKVSKFNLSVGQADALLGRFGINLPPAARGLADIADMSTKAEGALGLLGKASLVAGAAFAGWEVGKWIGDVTGWTDAIADATAKALGFGDVAGQEAAAGLDNLARATAIAGRAITDQTEAMRINQEEAQRKIGTNKALAASELEVAAAATEAARIYENNRTKLQKLEHDLAVAQVTRAADDKAAYAAMKTASTTALGTAVLGSMSANEQYAAGMLDINRNQQEMDIQTSQRRAGAATSRGGASSSLLSGWGGMAPITIHVSGVFDPASSQKIAQVVGQTQTQLALQNRRW